MKPEYTPLAKLTENSKAYKVKVKVIQKAQPRQSPGKRRFQKLPLKDEEGTVVKGTLFQDDIESFEKALERNGEYEISGATIQAVPPQFQNKPNEMQMNFNERVKITPISLEKCTSEPQYIRLAALPCSQGEGDELLDVIGALLYVGETRDVKYGDIDYKVREIVIKDESLARPMTISAWNEFARIECETLTNWVESFKVIGFRRLRYLTRRGLSLGTTMSTVFIMEPTGDRAGAIRSWVQQNTTTLADCRAKLLLIYHPPSNKPITTIAEIERKKADTTWQEEKYWLEVTIPTADGADLYCYLGCNKCGRRTQENSDAASVCTHCIESDASSVPRATFTFYATDATSAYKFTIFTRDVETLFGCSCGLLHNIKESGDTLAMDKRIEVVRKQHLLLQVGPTKALSTSQVLKWVVRSLVLKEDDN